MPITIFDLDETLIAGDSDYEWGQFLIDKRLVNTKKFKEMNDRFYKQYKEGALNIDEYLNFSCSTLTQYSIQELQAFRSEFVAERIAPIILKEAQNLVENHRKQGDTLLVITATIEFITRPIVDKFGIDTLIAPEPEILADRYTGKTIGLPSFGEGKVTRLHQWLKTQEISMEGSYFYSDSHNDLPLLRLVDNPVAVDPDQILKDEAQKHNWPIITLRG